MRYNFYEQKRLKLIETIKMERLKVANEEQAGSWVNPQHGDNYFDESEHNL